MYYLYQKPITIRWDGWKDDLSGVREYYIEVFKLEPNRDDRLVETKPIDPEFSSTVPHQGSEMVLNYTPSGPGMYRLDLWLI